MIVVISICQKYTFNNTNYLFDTNYNIIGQFFSKMTLKREKSPMEGHDVVILREYISFIGRRVTQVLAFLETMKVWLQLPKEEYQEMTRNTANSNNQAFQASCEQLCHELNQLVEDLNLLTNYEYRLQISPNVLRSEHLLADDLTKAIEMVRALIKKIFSIQNMTATGTNLSASKRARHQRPHQVRKSRVGPEEEPLINGQLPQWDPIGPRTGPSQVVNQDEELTASYMFAD